MSLFFILIIQSTSGILIENFSFVTPKVQHLKTSQACDDNTLREQAKSFESSSYYSNFHTLYFCNSKSPFLQARLKDLSVIEWVSGDFNKFFLSSEGHPHTIKKDLINFHSAYFLSSFSSFFLSILSLSSLILLITGLKPFLTRMTVKLMS